MIIFLIVVMMLFSILFAFGKFIEGITQTEEFKAKEREHYENFNARVSEKWQVDVDAMMEGDYAHASSKTRRDKQVTNKNH